MIKSLFLLVLLVFFANSSRSQEKSFPLVPGSESKAEGYIPVIIESTFWSYIVNDNFKIFISLPEHYDGFRKKKYPVLYFLDGGNTTFHSITAEYMQSGLIPEIITIGIGYPGASQRNRDYTYGYQNFYEFLKQELLPEIDNEFNTDTLKRTLFGHSFGGIFTLMAMFQYSDYNDIPFHNLIAASPSIWWPDGQQAFTFESSLYSQTNILPVNLYMTVGSLEGSMVTDLLKMDRVLESRNYEYFNLYSTVNIGEDHSSNNELTFRNGIKWILNQSVQIPPETAVGILSHKQKDIVVFPNPVRDILNVKFAEPGLGGYPVELINSTGKALYQVNSTEANLKIDVSAFPKGIYLLKIKEKEDNFTRKIIIN